MQNIFLFSFHFVRFSPLTKCIHVLFHDMIALVQLDTSLVALEVEEQVPSNSLTKKIPW